MFRPRGVAKHIIHKTPPVKRLEREREQLRITIDTLEKQKHQIIYDTRLSMSFRFIKGEGIEIGALHMPLPLPSHAKARYVDYIPVEELRQQYPELKDLDLVDVSIVDDGERLTKVKDNSVDFIVANHFLEHCQDPIGTIINFYKKLRPGGVLYMAVPDMRYTFDMRRPVTPYSHLLEEHKIYPSKKYYPIHTREVVELSENISGKKKIDARTKELMDMKYSIHHHVWTQKELIEFFNRTAEEFSLDLEIQAMANNVHEVVFIIQRRDPKVEKRKVKSIEKAVFSSKR